MPTPTYATLEDLIERAGADEVRQIADRDRDGTPDPDVVLAALQDADNLINGYVAKKYPLPLDEVPALVLTWAVSIARYMLHRNGAPEHVAEAYKTALGGLKDVSRGLIALPGADGSTPQSTAGTVMALIPDQIFTPFHLRGFK